MLYWHWPRSTTSTTSKTFSKINCYYSLDVGSPIFLALNWSRILFCLKYSLQRFVIWINYKYIFFFLSGYSSAYYCYPSAYSSHYSVWSSILQYMGDLQNMHLMFVHGLKNNTRLTRFCDPTKKKSIRWRHCQSDIGGPSVLCLTISRNAFVLCCIWLI